MTDVHQNDINRDRDRNLVTIYRDHYRTSSLYTDATDVSPKAANMSSVRSIQLIRLSWKITRYSYSYVEQLNIAGNNAKSHGIALWCHEALICHSSRTQFPLNVQFRPLVITQGRIFRRNCSIWKICALYEWSMSERWQQW